MIKQRLEGDSIPILPNFLVPILINDQRLQQIKDSGFIKSRPVMRVIQKRKASQIVVRKNRRIQIPKNVQNLLPLNPITTLKTLVMYEDQCEKACYEGLENGIDLFEQKYLPRIPKNTGALRENFMFELRRVLNKKRYPWLVKCGCPSIEYALYVHKFKPPINVAHGIDPKAVYQFFSRSVIAVRFLIVSEIENARKNNNIPQAIFKYLVDIIIHNGSEQP